MSQPPLEPPVEPPGESSAPADALDVAPRPVLVVTVYGSQEPGSLTDVESHVSSTLPKSLVAVLLRRLAATVEAGDGILLGFEGP